MIGTHSLVTASGGGVICTPELELGRYAAVLGALGCAFGILPHLAARLQTSARLFNVGTFAGGACLLCLARQILKANGALQVQAERARGAA